MTTTRVVVALLSGVLLTVGIVALRRDRQREAAWLLLFGFLGASVWSGLTFALAARGDAVMPRDAALSMTTMAIALTAYFLLKVVHREPIT